MQKKRLDACAFQTYAGLYGQISVDLLNKPPVAQTETVLKMKDGVVAMLKLMRNEFMEPKFVASLFAIMYKRVGLDTDGEDADGSPLFALYSPKVRQCILSRMKEEHEYCKHSEGRPEHEDDCIIMALENRAEVESDSLQGCAGDIGDDSDISSNEDDGI